MYVFFLNFQNFQEFYKHFYFDNVWLIFWSFQKSLHVIPVCSRILYIKEILANSLSKTLMNFEYFYSIEFFWWLVKKLNHWQNTENILKLIHFGIFYRKCWRLSQIFTVLVLKKLSFNNFLIIIIIKTSSYSVFFIFLPVYFMKYIKFLCTQFSIFLKISEKWWKLVNLIKMSKCYSKLKWLQNEQN